jgi:methionyl-tRNA formyltransferase
MIPLRIVFMGTAELACASLKALHESPDFVVIGVVTQPDRPKGRDLKLAPSHVKMLAGDLQLPVLQPEKARHPDFVMQLQELTPDLIVVAAYGQILPQSILDLPRLGCLNVHTSLLPKYRGASPIQSAILDDQPHTGVTIMKMDAGLDTGDILTQESTPIAAEDNAQTLHDRLATLGAGLLVRTVRDLAAGKIVPRPQPVEGVSHTKKIKKEDGLLDWQQPARVLWNRIRAFTPWPGAFTFAEFTGQKRMLKIWQAAPVPASPGEPGTILVADRQGIVVACGDGALRITLLQREGSRKMTAQEFLSGNPVRPGDSWAARS